MEHECLAQKKQVKVETITKSIAECDNRCKSNRGSSKMRPQHEFSMMQCNISLQQAQQINTAR